MCSIYWPIYIIKKIYYEMITIYLYVTKKLGEILYLSDYGTSFYLSDKLSFIYLFKKNYITYPIEENELLLSFSFIDTSAMI